MTPKEKAQELVEKFMEHTVEWDKIKEVAFDSEYHAKQCALIAVEELMRFEKASINLMNDFMKVVNLGFDRKGFYYEDVKNEIEKL
jgi:hypothetical protein